MVNLEALSPCGTELPLTIGTVALTEVHLPEARFGRFHPSPIPAGTSKVSKSSKTLWIGRDHGLQIGGTRPKSGAVTDQSDAWACVKISGDHSSEVMARLCPVDVRGLKTGAVVRSLIQHMTAIIYKPEDGVEVMVFRAFARTLIHDLSEAAKNVEARKGLGL